MNKRLIIAASIIVFILISAGILTTRPITGTWVCTDRLTESAMLTNEVTTLTIQPDGETDYRSYGDYIGRYRIQNGMGRWEQTGPGRYHITITRGIGVLCPLMGNCTYSELIPFSFTMNHDLIRDTIAFDPAAAPDFTDVRPFVRSIVLDCSEGCEGS